MTKPLSPSQKALSDRCRKLSHAVRKLNAAHGTRLWSAFADPSGPASLHLHVPHPAENVGGAWQVSYDLPDDFVAPQRTAMMNAVAACPGPYRFYIDISPSVRGDPAEGRLNIDAKSDRDLIVAVDLLAGKPLPAFKQALRELYMKANTSTVLYNTGFHLLKDEARKICPGARAGSVPRAAFRAASRKPEVIAIREQLHAADGRYESTQKMLDDKTLPEKVRAAVLTYYPILKAGA